MPDPRSSSGPSLSRPSLEHAFDEARFGPTRTLNLRASLPSREEATARAEAWLREKQMSRAGEVLVITGRGSRSEGGVSVVREAVVKLLASLRRRGVVAEVVEHTPGSFAVKLAPLTALRAAPRRRREGASPPRADPESLAGLSSETRELLRRLATRALEDLGVRNPAPFVEKEMLSQFALIAAAVPEGPDRERRLRDAIAAVLEEHESR